MRKYALAAICLVLLLVPMTVSAHRNYPNEAIGVNKSFSDDIYRFKLGEEVKVDVVSDLPIDVYIMTTVDYGSGLGPNYPGNFTPVYSVLNTTRTVFNWTLPDSRQYVIVVDNAVNNINGSANPSGTVTMTYIRTDNDEHGLSAEVVEAISLFCIGVVAVIAIIFVVVVIIVLIMRRRNKPVQAPPGSSQGNYGMPTASQAYQPAPAQYPQQPGQYMPPPPPPGSPGVPPPPGH